MAARYELEITITSARDLKNVNWKHGDLRPYAVVWVDSAKKCSTKVDVENDVNPVWDEKLKIPLPYDKSINECTLHIDVVHAKSDGHDDIKPLIGSAKLPLAEVVDEVGIGGKFSRSLKLKRPSGRPHGKLEIKVAIKEIERYNNYDPYAPPYGQPAPGGATRDYPTPPPPYGSNYPPYGQPPQYGYSQPYGAAPPPAGYPYSAPPPPIYGGPPPPVYGAAAPPVYGQGSYNGGGYGQGSYGQSYSSGSQAPVVVGEKKKSKFGMGTGLAVGAAAGVLGGLALAEGVDYVEDKIEDHVAEKVEDDLAYDDGGFDDGGFDDY